MPQLTDASVLPRLAPAGEQRRNTSPNRTALFLVAQARRTRKAEAVRSFYRRSEYRRRPSSCAMSLRPGAPNPTFISACLDGSALVRQSRRAAASQTPQAEPPRRRSGARRETPITIFIVRKTVLTSFTLAESRTNSRVSKGIAIVMAKSVSELCRSASAFAKGCADRTT
jgi:hypothetical protein